MRHWDCWRRLWVVWKKVVGALRWAMEFMLAQAGEVARVEGERAYYDPPLRVDG